MPAKDAERQDPPGASPRADLPVLVAMVAVVLMVGLVAARRSRMPSGSGLAPRAAGPELASLADLVEQGARVGPIQPLVDPRDQPPELVRLGARLFHERGLSADGSTSCASCHDIAQGGDDGRRVSIGVDGVPGRRNAPTVLNSRFNVRQFWDGRARTLEEQIDGPIEHPGELGSSWEQVLEFLAADPSYVEAFRDALGSGPSERGVRAAIAAFERSLVTPGAPFDDYLRGDEQAIDDSARRGYELFLEVGCSACHQGVNLGGNMRQRLGRMRSYFAEQGGPRTEGEEDPDGLLFKVPSLRNVNRTAPYFHDGSIETLREAVEVMATYQLGVALDDDQLDDLVSFLRTLDGDLPSLR